jgi:hypothetical protein
MKSYGGKQLPSEHEKEKAAHDELMKDAQEAARREAARLRQSVDVVLKTEAGQVMWGFLFRVCGYNKTSLTRKTDNDISEMSTSCKEAQRLVYIELRKLASPEILARTEQVAEFGVVTGEEKKDA